MILEIDWRSVGYWLDWLEIVWILIGDWLEIYWILIGVWWIFCDTVSAIDIWNICWYMRYLLIDIYWCTRYLLIYEIFIDLQDIYWYMRYLLMYKMSIDIWDIYWFTRYLLMYKISIDIWHIYWWLFHQEGWQVGAETHTWGTPAGRGLSRCRAR